MSDRPVDSAALRKAPEHRHWFRQQHTIGCVMNGTNGRGCTCPTADTCSICGEVEK